MTGVWKTQGKVEFKEVGTNLFLVEFREILDLKLVQEGCSWLFDQNLFCLTNYDGSLTTQFINFFKESMWVQMHNILFGMMNKIYGERLRRLIGDIIDYDVDKDGVDWGAFLHFRIWVDINKPLVQGCLIHNMEKPLWVSFKYERLPNFCFHCSIIKYPKLGCSKGPQSNKIQEIDETQYGT